MNYVRGFSTQVVAVPLERPMRTAIHSTEFAYGLVLQVECTESKGQGLLFALSEHRARALECLVHDLAGAYLGHPLDPEAAYQRALGAINAIGVQGFALSAVSAWDTACWDAIGTAQQRNLAQMWGSTRRVIPTYASSGLWVDQSVDEWLSSSERYIAQGHRALKVRVSDLADAEKVRAFQRQLPSGISLLVDANQSFGVEQAIEFGRTLGDVPIEWFEEPISHLDVAGTAIVREQQPLPIAGGETDWGAVGICPWIQADALDVLMPDLQRAGGLTGMRQVARAAEAKQQRFSTHIFPEHSLGFALSEPGCISMEHVDWLTPLFDRPMQIEGGHLVDSRRPGTGGYMPPDRIREFAI